jgi:hypothetical protein
MTEAESNACTDPQPMLEFLRGKTSDRKLQMFAVACAQFLWDLLNESSRRLVIALERYADGAASKEDLQSAEEGAREAFIADLATPSTPALTFQAAQAILSLQAHMIERGAICSMLNDAQMLRGKVAREIARKGTWTKQERSAIASEQHRQSALVRDIFGPLPFRPIALDRPWLTSTVTSLATAIYEERAFDRLPILADALEDAGCTNADILSHCRGPGPHVLGCWVVDLLLGKE